MKNRKDDNRKRILKALNYLENKHYPTVTSAILGRMAGRPLAAAYLSLSKGFVAEIMGRRLDLRNR